LRAVEQQICGESDRMGEVISGGSDNGSINKSSPPEHLQRRWIRLLLEDREMSLADADHYLCSKYSKGVGDDEREAWKRGVKWREKGGGASGVQKRDCARGGCGLQGPGGTEWGGVAAGGRSGDGTPPIRDPNFNMGQRWRGVIENALIEGQMLPNSLTAFPVFTQGNQWIWAPFDWKTVSQLQKTVTNYGLDNEQVMTLVTTFFKNQILVPADARALLELVLPLTAFMLWKDKWRDKCEVAMMQNFQLGADDPLRVVTLDQLMGTGAFRDGAAQAALHPRILQQSQSLALAALTELPQIGKPVLPYTQIRQGPDEPYMHFIDRLKEALDAAPNLPSEAKDAVGKDLAFQNASTQCQQIIASLPIGSTLSWYVKACSRLPRLAEEREKARIHAAAMAAVLRPAMQTGKWDRGVKAKTGCLICGEEDHYKRNCPQITKQKVVADEFIGTCHRCDRFGHKAAQ